MAKKSTIAPSVNAKASSSKAKVKAKSGLGSSGDVPGASASSIDDIFAKPKSKLASASTPASSGSKSHAVSKTEVKEKESTEKKKKGKGKGKTVASFIPDTEAPPASSSNAKDTIKAKQTERKVETVLDPSAPQPLASAEPVGVSATDSKMMVVGKGGKKRDRERNEDEEDEMFRDSRGDGPRRKTEEGFLIYKEAELKIDPEAGGTPLCPFDCECCF